MSWDLSRRRLLQLGGATADSVVLTGPRALAADASGTAPATAAAEKPPAPTWASAPANAVARHVLGVQVSAPGGAEFLIRPRTGALTDVAGTVPSVRGPVAVAVHRSGGAHTTRVTVPPNFRAVLEVEIRDADPAEYQVTATAPGGRGRVDVRPFIDLTGTVLRIGPVGSGATKVERTLS